MATHSVIVLRPRARPRKSDGFRRAFAEVVEEFVTFERTHARVAWGATLAGLVIGLALKSLG